MRRPTRLAVVAAVVTLLAVPAHAQAAKHPSRVSLPPEFYGVNAQALFSLPQARWGANLAAMRDGGLSVVRRDASWDGVEPAPPDPQTGLHTYHWETTDAMVGALAQYGLRWYPILDYSAPWASSVPGDPFEPPARAEDFTAFAAALAERYGPGGQFWREHPELGPVPVTSYEVWNEENSSQFWAPQADAAGTYADLYLATRTAVKAVDPRSRVVVGGLVTWNVGAFVREMYRHRPDLAGNVDAVGFHPYFDRVSDVVGAVAGLREVLKSVGAGRVPIDVTEVGWIADSSGQDESRAALFTSLARRLPAARLGVAHLIPHTWIETDDNPSDQWGIYNADGTPKASGLAFTAEVRRMESVMSAAALHVRRRPLIHKRVRARGGRLHSRPLATG